jgi:hypothetical protein
LAASACVGCAWGVVLFKLLGYAVEVLRGDAHPFLILAIGQIVLVVFAPLTVLMAIIVVNKLWRIPPEGVA